MRMYGRGLASAVLLILATATGYGTGSGLVSAAGTVTPRGSKRYAFERMSP